MYESISRFLQEIEQVPWLSKLGSPSERDADVFRIYSWETWPGPEEPGSEIQAMLYQKWRDDLMEGDAGGKLTALWAEIESKVRDLARRHVPYDDEEDTWHGPNAAVWQAGWLAAVMGCSIQAGRPYSDEYDPSDQWTPVAEWYWFCTGHWPCTYHWSWGHASLDRAMGHHAAKRLVVY